LTFLRPVVNLLEKKTVAMAGLEKVTE
jgi:hypothetical protein